MRTIFILLFLLSIVNLNSQTIYLKYPVLLDFNHQYIEALNKKDSSVITNLPSDSSRGVKVYNFNSLGHLSFMIFDNMHRLTVKGQYSESIALLSEYVATRKLNGKGEIKVRKFYQPLRDGLWYYYDESGKAYLKQKYLKGILIEEYSSKND